MCGRFTQTDTPVVIAQQFDVATPALFTPRYNIIPSQAVAAIRIEPATTTLQLVLLRWGLIPFWAQYPKIGHQCINAKAKALVSGASGIRHAVLSDEPSLGISSPDIVWQDIRVSCLNQ
jgi:putative SOS response-associated peptidase YedK